MPVHDLVAVSKVGEAILSGAAGAVGAALVAGAFGVYRIAIGRKEAERERRRGLYSEAYRTALEWCEAVYRVRRRASDASEDRALVERFHDMQERIVYYEGWLSMEALELGDSYRAFLEAVRRECEPLIRTAWSNPGREPTAPTPEEEADPALAEARAAFIRDVREHLSRRFRERRAVKNRYPKEKS